MVCKHLTGGYQCSCIEDMASLFKHWSNKLFISYYYSMWPLFAYSQLIKSREGVKRGKSNIKVKRNNKLQQ